MPSPFGSLPDKPLTHKLRHPNIPPNMLFINAKTIGPEKASAMTLPDSTPPLQKTSFALIARNIPIRPQLLTITIYHVLVNRMVGLPSGAEAIPNHALTPGDLPCRHPPTASGAAKWLAFPSVSCYFYPPH
jgi:hypothetical protein